MTGPLGSRSPQEAEHDAGPLHVIATELFDGEPRIAADEAGAIPCFALAEHAELCAAELRETGLFRSVAVVECWANFVSAVLLAADGRDPADLSDSEVEQIIQRSYLVEAGTFGPEDAKQIARETSGRIVRGIAERFERGLRDADEGSER